MMMTKGKLKKLCLTRPHPRIPEGVTIPPHVRTRAELSWWLIEELGFNRRDRDYWDIFRLLRDEFPPGEPGPEPDRTRPVYDYNMIKNRKAVYISRFLLNDIDTYDE
jgi:hypothetical protein